MSARRCDGSTEVQTPRRPQRLKRSTPVPRTEPSPLVQKLRTKFESQAQRNGEAQPNGVSANAERRGDCGLYGYARKNLQPARNGSGADRPASGGAARGARKHAEAARDNRTWVLQRARQYECAASGSTTPPTMSGPPVKPPRTFAHDIYTEAKLRPNPLYGAPARRRGTVPSLDDVGHDCEDVPRRSAVAAAADRAVLRRSRSDEHIYAEPGAPTPDRRAPQCAGRASAPRELHYMSSPIAGATQEEGGAPSGPGAAGRGAFTSLVRDAINQSFTLRKGGKRTGEAQPGGDMQAADSGSEVSAKDLEKRLVYVRSIRRDYPEGPAGGTPDRLLEFVLVVGYRHVCPAGGAPQPDVLHHFPRPLDCPGYDPVVISQLCMPQPFDSEDVPHRSVSFFFTLVQNGERTFFHCLHVPKDPGGALAGSVPTPVVLCLATRVSAPAFYRRLLGQLEGPLRRLDRERWEELLAALAKQGLPSPGCRMVCQRLGPATQGQGDVAIAFSRPLDEQFDWAPLTPLLGVLEPAVLLRIVSSLILERRLILVSEHCQQVRGWVSSVEALVYPFRWAHVRVPLVPRSLLAQCSSPEPYLLGLHAALAHTALELLSGPVLVVDVDRGQLLREDEDNRGVLPDKLQRSLCTALSLANSMTDPTGRVRDLMIREACVRLFVELVGHCDQHLSPDADSSSFQREAFVRAPSSRGGQLFLQWFVETEAFEQFLRERSQRLCQLARTPHHHLLPKGLFERRAAEYLLDLEQSGRGLRQLGRRVRTIGERFWNLKAFQRD